MIAPFCLLIQMVLATRVSQSLTSVDTIYGPIHGLDFGTHRRFQGVPFASPPLGALRFKDPIPPTPWTTPLNCTYFDTGCAQRGHSLDVPKNTSEDCLYLEVWAPALNKYATPANVMIFLYGGDFKEGGESFALYDGTYMASTTNTMVVIANYRLGVLGFLFSSYNDPNVGIQDQRFAMQWVQLNAKAFGGSPDSVTIFGESAGAESVLLHYTEPNQTSAQWWHRAIAESDVVLDFRIERDALELASSFVGILGCVMGNLTCLQEPNITTILDAGHQALVVPLSVGEAVAKWSPVVDGHTVTTQPFEALAKGDIVHAPLLMGANKDDGVLFAFAIAGGNKGTLISIEYIAIVAGIWQDQYIADILLRYPPVWTGDNRYVLAKLFTDALFFCPARATLRLANAAGVKDVYLYQFNQQPPFSVWPPSQEFCNHYVCHGDELPYIFRDSGSDFPWNMTGPVLYLANASSAFWTTFAATGSPGGIWPQYRSATDMSISLDYPLSVMTGVKEQECDFFDKVGYVFGPRVVFEKAKKIVADLRRRK